MRAKFVVIVMILATACGWSRAASLASAPTTAPVAIPAASTRPAGPSPIDIEKAMAQLKSADWILKAEGMSLLGQWRHAPAAPAVREILIGKDVAWLRGRALVALANIQGQGALKDAQGLTAAPDIELLAAAMEALGVIGDLAGKSAIAAGFKDPAPAVKYQAAIAWARLLKKDAWDQLVPLLADPDPVMVRHATRALTFIDTDQARQKLLAMLGHANAEVRQEACRDLSAVGMTTAIPALLKAAASDGDKDVRAVAELALLTVDPKQLADPAVAALRGDDASQYGLAIRLLGLARNPAATEQLAQALRQNPDRYLPVLPSALMLLTSQDAARYQDVFVKFLDHAYVTVRQLALKGLAQCPKADLFATLKKHLVEANPQMAAFRADVYRVLAEDAKGSPAEGIVSYVADALASQDVNVRRAAMGLLSAKMTASDAAKAVEALRPFLAGTDDVSRRAAAAALERVSDDGGKARVAAMQGCLTDWMAVGPFPNDKDNKSLATAYPPEKEIDLKATYRQNIGLSMGAATEIATPTLGDKKTALLVTGPVQAERGGKAVIEYSLTLPERKDLKLQVSAGLIPAAEGETGDGAALEIAVDRKKILEKTIASPGSWNELEADMAEWSGKKVVLTVSVDTLSPAGANTLALGELRLTSGEQTVADLVEQSKQARPHVEIGESDRAAASWKSCPMRQTDGSVTLDTVIAGLPPRIAYALAEVESPLVQPVDLLVDLPDAGVLWLNDGKPVNLQRGPTKTTVELKKGRNRLLLKLTSRSSISPALKYAVRVTDSKGLPVPTLKSVDLSPEAPQTP